ncbi:hypothetical protein TVAG_316060 [Trichomonas vaginalis G3]|uniref:Uncharacterized protein n=1 Tax=Trichomonas vaginalis (strain ATCC PRA-98 / G3) TaxID=412133 RepID=A2FAW4_TRIV3|nr:hypothetical protein TVAGG3_0888280 [Trichomonas vaginalis G3]EAX97941.1 hypothetical protein TVAG_316060 [Trichomonas vaginalis G3]KAI5502537.1 hypothetical protein TVAGG3_0888280 [Trichomonas vaginalis G3]|eukprot:XP_001310871.1 hypothetical protein [Trichomonas vaginalis G3]
MSCWSINSQVFTVNEGEFDAYNIYELDTESYDQHKVIFENLKPLISKYSSNSLTKEDIGKAIIKIKEYDTFEEGNDLKQKVYAFLELLNYKDKAITRKELIDSLYPNTDNNIDSSDIFSLLEQLLLLRDVPNEEDPESAEGYINFNDHYLRQGGSEKVADILTRFYEYQNVEDFRQKLVSLQKTKIQEFDDRVINYIIGIIDREECQNQKDFIKTIIVKAAFSGISITADLIMGVASKLGTPKYENDEQTTELLYAYLLQGKFNEFASHFYDMTNDFTSEFTFVIFLKFILSLYKETKFDEDESITSIVIRRYCQYIASIEELIDYIPTYFGILKNGTKNQVFQALNPDIQHHYCSNSTMASSGNGILDLISIALKSNPISYDKIFTELNRQETLLLTDKILENIILNLLKLPEFPANKLNPEILIKLIDVANRQIDHCTDKQIVTQLRKFLSKFMNQSLEKIVKDGKIPVYPISCFPE